MKSILQLIICLAVVQWVKATTLHVGAGQTYSTFAQAAAVAAPGDTVLFHEGIYNGGHFFANLQGSATQPITLMAVAGDTVIHRGGSNGWQLSDAAHLNIHHLIFEQQTGNGFNLDDAATINTPAHHILFERCIFRDMNASGNNDLLKLSGLDSFEIRNCSFLNGSVGGSGIDMVGCHHGLIHENYFENMGSNAIQAKGGTQFIRIERNYFKNCGARSINLGGSTGLQFFRPINATFEAADLQVYANVFVGSDAPVAFVGCERVHVINNTIVLPVRWALRILQETVDTTRFVKCGNNSFRNNIIYRSNSLSTDCNVGPNTAPQTFTFSNNLWYNYENANWSGPALPVTDSNRIVGSNPLFNDMGIGDYSIPVNSPAVGAGYNVSAPQYDFTGNSFTTPRSIGAYEGNPLTVNVKLIPESVVGIYPNPFRRCATVLINDEWSNSAMITLYDLSGKKILSQPISSEFTPLCVPETAKGIYYYRLTTKTTDIASGKVVVF